MNIRTQCLDLLILLVTFDPIVLAQLFLTKENSYNESLERSFKALAIIYAIILVGIFIISKEKFYINIDSNYHLYIMAIIFVPITICWEIIAGYIMLGVSNKAIPKFKISLVFTKTNINVIILSVFIGICEEFAYRQLWFNILFKDFKMNIAIVLIITSFVYALNHIFLGKQVFFQKMVAGLIYGALFYFSGFNIIVPIITHCLENIVILLKG
ncbi:CPBP family intramembrane metalloprotease [Clostridium botulinum]|uniref:CAAX amino terminal protease family protein n=1 Tax=Clostridium botulinum (strain Okra / Type B1) TaxID=498213 RepID=B1IEK0_CLOBK|nr:CPBP family intramembrane glutamic endopeptidase [Clostridium botulinum]EKX80886.1 CAAX amino terminal protease [Clostridium botulinum CFSAN001628]ACA44328.1 CAAX amino terminal protease family protein [Clostridium botulinum B1 str. Okra]MBD5562059.1 CPBP family intramembrane metalloprotease [Clostridium botulinum]MBD5567898.1 CPBP family intramembrane metalloprotease [Clostridium botulinum]MBD5570953.1 CPBP family intramembrane metalloprotease [Clostridium botulinum]